MKRSRKIATITGTSTLAAGAVALALFLPGTASAGTAAPSPASAPAVVTTVSLAGSSAPTGKAHAGTASSGDRVAGLACRTFNKSDTKLKKAEARLNGPATAKGSIAAIKAKAAADQKAGHTAAAKKLTKRAAGRTTGLATLTKQEGDLAKLITADCG